MTPGRQAQDLSAPERSPSADTICRTSIYALFGLSGFCALIFEILWLRHLSLAFGTTMVAVSTVAAVFMGGLALGNYWLGKRADRAASPLRLYAYLEAGIALSGLLFPFALELTTSAYVSLSRLTPSLPAVSTIFHTLFASLLLLPPTVFMGGTFPVMCRFFRGTRPEGAAGRLYAINTLGATLGTFLAGFFLIPTLGLAGTARLAIGLNFFIAISAYLFSGRTTSSGATACEGVSETSISPDKGRYPLVCIAFVGAFALAYEILWTRVLLLFLGSTVYAFSTILSVFLIGIALGAALAAAIRSRAANLHFFFVLLLSLMGTYVLATWPFYDRLAFLFQAVHQIAQGRWFFISTGSFLIAALIMIPPAACSGALLPLAIDILKPSAARVGEVAGRVVMWNTLGAIFGSLIAGLLLTPALGLQNSFRLAGGLNLMLALVLYLAQKRSSSLSPGLAVILTAGVLLALLPARWDMKLMTAGVYYNAYGIEEAGGLRPYLRNHEILEVFEGIDSTVAVNESSGPDVRFLTINGKTDASNGFRDMETQLLLGHLPLLLHQRAETALIIGLGSGITLGAATEYPLKLIDCIEISAAVAKASTFFSRENRQALLDHRVALKIQDARNFLLTQPRRYDVIISEPSNPWQSGNANLFTSEFYELVDLRLEEGGVFCQWLPLYDTTPGNLRIILKTFQRHFPEIMAFITNESDLLLVGSKSALAFDYLRMDEHMRGRDNLAILGLSSPGRLIAKTYLFSQNSLTEFTRGASLSSDNHPLLEYGYQDIFQPRILERNLAALYGSVGRERLPLVNPGSTADEKRSALLDLGEGFSEAGRTDQAQYFFDLARQY